MTSGAANVVPNAVASEDLESSEQADGSRCVLPSPIVGKQTDGDAEDAFYGAIPSTIVGGRREGRENWNAENTTPPRAESETNRIRVSMLNGDLVLEAEVGPTTVEDLKDIIFELTRIKPYRQQLVMDGEELPFLGPGTLVELRSLGVGLHGTSKVLLVVLDEDTESMAPMTIGGMQSFTHFSELGHGAQHCMFLDVLTGHDETAM